METKSLSLDELVRDLNELFSLDDWDKDPGMHRWLPRVYEDIGRDYTEIFEADFCERFNGLMLRSASVVKEVYCAAFPSPDVIKKLLATADGDALLFLHHPVDMEVSGVGFLPVLPDNLERLSSQGISIYACHAPMDCHDEIGTNASIVEALDIQVEQHFAWYGNGFAGRIGSITPVSLDELVKKGRKIFGGDRMEVGGAGLTTISKVAIVAGGGDDPELFKEAEQAGAHVYLTGEWYTRTTPLNEEGKAWAKANRAACKAYAQTSAMAFLGVSHAASEFLVMKTQMADYFQQKGLHVVCLEQSDWWR